MANDWVTDQKWRDIKHQDLPDWVKRRVKELDHHPLTGRSFEYRREPATGKYQRRLCRTPVNISKLHQDGLALGRLGKHKEAIACFDKALKLNPKDNVAWHRKGIELNALGKYNNAIDCFDRAIRINSRDKFAWNHRAVSLCKLGNYKEAMACCKKAIKIDNSYHLAWCNKANISGHLGALKDYEKSSRRAGQLAPELGPKGTNKQLLVEAEQAMVTNLHKDGLTLSKLRNHKQAIACFDKAIRINEKDHTAWHRKGIELNALGKFNDAIGCFDRAIRINTRDKFAWNHRALSLCRLGNYEDAITSCNEAIKIDDTYPFAWYNKANIANRMGDCEEYEKCLAKIRQLGPNESNEIWLKNEGGMPTNRIRGKPESAPRPAPIKPSGSSFPVEREEYYSAYYCAKLCLVHLQISDISGALKCAMDLRNYATTVEIKNKLDQLIDELEYRRKEGISVPEELVERAGAALHQASMGR